MIFTHPYVLLILFVSPTWNWIFMLLSMLLCAHTSHFAAEKENRVCCIRHDIFNSVVPQVQMVMPKSLCDQWRVRGCLDSV